jgi:Protein of unknown function (DUF3148)
MVFQVGDSVRLTTSPPYLKTAEPMPIMKPATIVPVGSVGIILDRKPGGYWAVRFERGAYLLEEQYLNVV